MVQINSSFAFRVILATAAIAHVQVAALPVPFNLLSIFKKASPPVSVKPPSGPAPDLQPNRLAKAGAQYSFPTKSGPVQHGQASHAPPANNGPVQHGQASHAPPANRPAQPASRYRGYPEIHELEAPKLPATNQPPRATRRTQDAAALAAQADKIQPKVLVRLPTLKVPKPIRAAVDTPPTGIPVHILHNAPPQSQILPPPLSLLPPPPTGNPIPPTGTRFLTTTLKPPSALPPGRPGEFPRQSYTDNHSRLFRYHR